MLQGLGMITELKSGLGEFMEQHEFKSVQEMVGKSLPYFTTHHNLVELQAESKALKIASRASTDKSWGEESLAEQTRKMTSNES
jgi:dihydropyrimidine dehydrogenase (NADP+)